MGQYYYVVNLDKKEYLHPHKFDEGMKLMEFGCNRQGTLMALAVLLADGNGRGGGDLGSNSPVVGSWAGDRIVISGDYADPQKFVELNDEELAKISSDRMNGEIENKPSTMNLHQVAYLCFTDISEKIIKVLQEAGEKIRCAK